MHVLLRNAMVVFAVICLMVAFVPRAGVHAAEAGLEDAVLKEKCGLCHSSKRILTLNPDQLKPVLERMQKMNPDWISDIDSEHIATILADVLGKPEVIRVREAWFEAVERGKALFTDETLGTNGKACTDCHAVETMRQVADSYPQYDLELRRIVSFEERVRRMVREQLAGELQEPMDQRLLDVIAYLKSLY